MSVLNLFIGWSGLDTNISIINIYSIEMIIIPYMYYIIYVNIIQIKTGDMM